MNTCSSAASSLLLQTGKPSRPTCIKPWFCKSACTLTKDYRRMWYAAGKDCWELVLETNPPVLNAARYSHVTASKSGYLGRPCALQHMASCQHLASASGHDAPAAYSFLNKARNSLLPLLAPLMGDSMWPSELKPKAAMPVHTASMTSLCTLASLTTPPEATCSVITATTEPLQHILAA